MNKIRCRSCWVGLQLVVFFLLAASASFAQTKPFVHQLFSSNMVLQRDASDPVWGWTTPSASVTVTINGQTKSAVAGADGRWEVQVGPFAAGGPYTLQVTGPQSKTFTNVLFGDVFLCSGQSNMEVSVNTAYNASTEVADSVNYPNVRSFTVPKVSALTPQENISGGTWLVPGSSTTGGFSATAYFMAREIYKQQNVPIGFVASSWGGTQIQSWVDFSVSSSVADFTQLIFDQAAGAATGDTISGHYNGLIHPLAPFRFKAAVWYQGEFNSGRGQQYSRLLPGLLSGWRALFGQPNLPFIVVQLPNNDAAQTQPVETGGWSEIREAQANAVRADAGRSRLVMTIDIGEGNLHPLDKQDIGQRASWAAANLVYGQSVVGQGPIFTGATISGNTIQCSFSDIGAGLMVGTKNPKTPLSAVQEVVGGTVNGFSIAGADHVFYFGTATITGANTVSVTSASVAAPLYVRYGWANNPVCNLYNKITNSGGTVINGLPAGSFRNDPVYKLNTNASGGGKESYTIPTTSTVTASVPTGEVFDHWGGDTGKLAASGTSSKTATLDQIYVSLRAYFRITSAPPSVTVSAQVGQIGVAWGTLSSVHYNVKRSTTSGGPYTTIAPNLYNVTSYIDTNVAEGTTYYYVVAAVNEVGEGPNSAQLSAVPISFVRNVAAVGGDAKVDLSWSAYNGPVESYSVKRSETAGGPYETIASGLTTLNFTDRAVVGGVTYYYVITAVNGSVQTPTSPGVAAVPKLLPSPWLDQDIGATGVSGGASDSLAGVYRVVGAGAGIGTSPDAFHFAYVRLSGDGTITARVASQQANGAAPEAGVMMRASLGADSPYAREYVNSTQNSFQSRSTIGGSATTSTSTSSNKWVRVVRTGNSFTGFTSSNGTSWTQTGSPVTFTATDPIYVGFAVSSRAIAVGHAATFDNVSVTSLSMLPPEVPSGLSKTLRAGGAEATLKWNAASGAAVYNVKRATVHGGPYTTVASGIGATKYACSALTSGAKYYFVISALNVAGESANSSEITVDLTSVGAQPPKPTGVTILRGATPVVLNWNASSVASSYNVKRGTASGGPYTTIASPTTNTYTDATAINGTNYYYVISAVNSSGESANSAQVATTPQSFITCGIRAQINSSYVTASGTSPLIASKGLIGVNEIFEKVDLGSNQFALRAVGNGQYVSALNATTSLAANKTTIGNTEKFNYSDKGSNTFAFQSVGNSQWVSADASGANPLIANRASAGSFETFLLVPLTSLPIPGDLTATPGDQQVTLAWSDSGEAYSYNVRRASASGGPYSLIATTTLPTYVDTGRTNGATYYYVVSANGSSGGSANSAEVSSVPNVQPTAEPTALAAIPLSESQIQLTWADNATDATSYIVQRSLSGAASWTTVSSGLGGNATSFLDQNLMASTDYDYRVQCTGPNGASAFAPVFVSTPAGIGDGIPGWWRYQYFGNGLTITSASALAADGDGDGATNQQEYLAGTDPTNPASVLKISALTVVGGDIQFGFTSANGKSYVAEKTDSLSPDTVWSVVQDNISGTGGNVLVNDAGGAQQPRRFYRIKIK